MLIILASFHLLLVNRGKGRTLLFVRTVSQHSMMSCINMNVAPTHPTSLPGERASDKAWGWAGEECDGERGREG